MILSPGVFQFLPELWPLCAELLRKDPRLSGTEYYLLSYIRRFGDRPGAFERRAVLSISLLQPGLQRVGIDKSNVTHAMDRLESPQMRLVRRIHLGPADQELVFGEVKRGRRDFVVLENAGELRLERFDSDVAALFGELLQESGLTPDEIAKFAEPLKDKAPQFIKSVRERCAAMAEDRRYGDTTPESESQPVPQIAPQGVDAPQRKR
jgi:hypothetical protein